MYAKYLATSQLVTAWHQNEVQNGEVWICKSNLGNWYSNIEGAVHCG